MNPLSSQPPSVLVEPPTRLSSSSLWNWQKSAYKEFGPEAWTQKGVPFYITSNPYIAKQYAEVVLGFLRDYHRNTKKLPKEPITLLELGAGSGKFSYLFLKELMRMHHHFRKDPPFFRYVMTDIAEKNLEFWQRHPLLQPFVEQGILDFAQYNPLDPAPPYFLGAKKALGKSSAPLIVLANYFFDTITQDLFRLQDGHLLEGRIALYTAEQEKALSEAHLISKLHYTYEYHPIEAIDTYYPSREWNKLLHSYHTLPKSTFLFPVGAFTALNHLLPLTTGPFMLLVGDKGIADEKALSASEHPKLNLHGTFSFPVNFHALSLFFQQRGGEAHLSLSSYATFGTGLFLLRAPSEVFVETYHAFKERLLAFDPNDYWAMVTQIEKEGQELSFEQILLLLKFGNWDIVNFHHFYKTIKKHLPLADEAQKGILAQAMHRLWENFYPLCPEESLLISNMGLIFCDMDLYEKASEYFEKALTLNEKNFVAQYGWLLSLQASGQNEKAKKLFSQFKEKNPELGKIEKKWQ